MKYSIIIPAYNVENLIGDCLRSVVSQNYATEEYEILIVDDCSTDNTISKIQEFKALYSYGNGGGNPNVSIIKHEHNMRQGGARNTGIKHAKGDYILFIDSDDYLSGTNILSELDAVISKRECSFVRSSSIHRVAFDSMPILRDEIRNPKIEYLDSETYILSSDFCCEIVKGCYNRRFLCDNELYFREHVAYEDTDWMFKVCAKAETIALIDFPFYCYRHNPSSVTNRPSTASMINNIQALSVLYDILENGKQEYSCDVKRKMYRRIGNSMKGLLTKSYRYEIKDDQKIISSIPDTLYNISVEFQAGTKILFFFENHFSLPIIIALRMAYRLKCIIDWILWALTKPQRIFSN